MHKDKYPSVENYQYKRNHKEVCIIQLKNIVSIDTHRGVYTSGEKKITKVYNPKMVNIIQILQITGVYNCINFRLKNRGIDSHNGVYSSGKENHVMDSQRGIYSSLQWTGIKLNILQLKNIIYEEKKRRVESD